MRGIGFGGLLLLLVFAVPAWARQEATAEAGADTEPLDTSVHADVSTSTIAPVVVSGLQPGPRLWKVSRDGHVMWVLGTQSPLPKGLDWAPGETAARVREARVVLRPPMVKVDADIGFFSGLALLPRALSARKNPDGRTLAQVLPADVYARWVPLKSRYLGRDRGVEKFRPLFAASELWDAAIRKSGLSREDIAWREIADLVEETKPDVRRPTITVKLQDPGKILKQLKGTALDDTACFERTLTRLEGDLDNMRKRGNAWAVGDLATLRALPYVDAAQACQDAMMSVSIVKERGLGDLDARAEAAWLAEAERTIKDAAVSFAVLPIQELLEADGYIARLRARGYVVDMRD